MKKGTPLTRRCVHIMAFWTTSDAVQPSGRVSVTTPSTTLIWTKKPRRCSTQVYSSAHFGYAAAMLSSSGMR